MGKVIGIDLGTTNSCVAVKEGDNVTVIPNPEGQRTTPSVVAFSKDGEILVGQLAKRQAIVNPDRTVISIKRSMGSDKTVSIDGKSYTPQQISAMILQKPGLLHRRPAPGDEGRGNHRGPQRAPHHQRANGGLPRLRRQP